MLNPLIFDSLLNLYILTESAMAPILKGRRILNAKTYKLRNFCESLNICNKGIFTKKKSQKGCIIPYDP